jgi:hypothetical protein
VKNDDNVVPFDPMRRGGMARRGAPDKTEIPASPAVVLACPSCASELRLEEEWLDGQAELLCGRCDTEISLVSVRRRSGTS